MPQRRRTTELHPRVFFNTNAIISHMWGWEVDGGESRAEDLSKEVLAESWRDLGQAPPERGLRAAQYDVGAGAGFPDLFYLLDQLRPWLGTVADLIALGALARVIVEKVRERMGEAGRFVYFSREVLEGMCVERLRQRTGEELRQVSVRSDGFETWFGKGNLVDDPAGEQVYLVWVSRDAETYQFVIDSNGKVWAEYRISPESRVIERLTPGGFPKAEDA